MKINLIILLAVCGVVTGCRSDKTSTYSPYSKTQRSEIRREALNDAATIIASGKLYVCETGTFAIYLPGVPSNHADLVRDLPRHGLPSGCTNPSALRSIAYAEVFNGEIVKYLSERK